MQNHNAGDPVRKNNTLTQEILIFRNSALLSKTFTYRSGFSYLQYLEIAFFPVNFAENQ